MLNTAITPSISTDHSIISLTLSISQMQPRGKGTWKFNNSLLKDKKYVNMVKKIIQETQVETSFTNKCLLWEFIKCKVRSETMVYSSHKAKLGRKREVELLYRLEKLESQLKSEENDLSHTEYYSVKKEWEELCSEKTQGAILRSKAKYVEEGEKNSKYFLNMEKWNYNNKYMKSVMNSEGLTINNPTKILEEQVSFFQNLYSSRVKLGSKTKQLRKEFLQNIQIPKLVPNEQVTLSQPITIKEITNALKDMANDKTPDLDGFTTNFYKFFWPNIKEILDASYIIMFF